MNMQTIEEIRRDWLLLLIKKHKTIANLNIALDRPRTDGTLSQIKNQAPDSKTGTPKNMGSPVAREIEAKLGLEAGVLDHPPNATYAISQEEVDLLKLFREIGEQPYRGKVIGYAMEQLELMRAHQLGARLRGAGKGGGAGEQETPR